MRPFLFSLPDWLPGPLSGRPIFSYGAMLAVSFMLGIAISLRIGERHGVERKAASNTLFVALVCSLIGARLFYFFTDWDKFSLVNFFKVTEGGLVAYGGYIGGLGGAFIYALFKKFDFFSIADMAAPQMALGLGFTRWGCFLYGCDYGERTDLPWGLNYPRWDMPSFASWIKGSSPAFNDHLHQRIIDGASAASLSVHPTQLYESMTGFIIFAALFLFTPLRKFRGQVVLLFLIIYSAARFLLEFLRGDVDRGERVLGTMFSFSQVISIILIVISVYLWFYLKRFKPVVEPEPVRIKKSKKKR